MLLDVIIYFLRSCASWRNDILFDILTYFPYLLIVMMYLFTYFLTVTCTFWRQAHSWIMTYYFTFKCTSWRYDALFLCHNIICYFMTYCMLRYVHIFWRHDVIMYIMTYILSAWCLFGHHDVLFDVMMYFLTNVLKSWQIFFTLQRRYIFLNAQGKGHQNCQNHIIVDNSGKEHHINATLVLRYS